METQNKELQMENLKKELLLERKQNKCLTIGLGIVLSTIFTVATVKNVKHIYKHIKK